LEKYADAIAREQGIVPWHRRKAGRRVPNGWNSWTGSSSSGGYGTDIDETIILDNLDVMAAEFRDWGMDWFQMDDGYEPYYGDWWFREDRFPHGPRWLSDQIRARGLRPGLWLAPFDPSPDSELYHDHPDWIAEKTDYGSISSEQVLDLTNPEVLAYLKELFEQFRNDWGFEWLKLDFGYHALLGTNYYDPTKTREEAWRNALQVIRDALGEDSFFLVLGPAGNDYDLIDSSRTTLDNMPVWDWTPESSAYNRLNQQGLKPTVRTSGRRWYLQDRVWINHPDLIFFRSNPRDDSWPRLTLDESKAFCSYVGLSGGIVKLGDRLVDLQADHINAIRTLLPVYPGAARPLDVFTREFPEAWHETVNEPLDGFDETWELFGLFNWGFNWDLTANPFEQIADDGSVRHHEVDLTAQGLDGVWLAYEFWTQTFLGEMEGTLVLDVPPHTARVVALRRKTDVPQFLGWNRQITMGGTLVYESTWDAGANTLQFRGKVAAPTAKAPFVYEVAFHVPDGYGEPTVQTDGVAVEDLMVAKDSSVVRVRFVPTATGDLGMNLAF